MAGIAELLAAFAAAHPGVGEARQAAIVERRCPRRAIARVQHACVNEQQRDEEQDGDRQPRDARAAQADDERNRREENRQPRPRQPGVLPLVAIDLASPRGQTVAVEGLYGRTLPSVFHRYSVRVPPELSMKVSTLSAFQSPMLKLCETMRDPGFNWEVRIGRSFRLDADSR